MIGIVRDSFGDTMTQTISPQTLKVMNRLKVKWHSNLKISKDLNVTSASKAISRIRKLCLLGQINFTLKERILPCENGWYKEFYLSKNKVKK